MYPFPCSPHGPLQGCHWPAHWVGERLVEPPEMPCSPHLLTGSDCALNGTSTGGTSGSAASAPTEPAQAHRLHKTPGSPGPWAGLGPQESLSAAPHGLMSLISSIQQNCPVLPLPPPLPLSHWETPDWEGGGSHGAKLWVAGAGRGTRSSRASGGCWFGTANTTRGESGPSSRLHEAENHGRTGTIPQRWRHWDVERAWISTAPHRSPAHCPHCPPGAATPGTENASTHPGPPAGTTGCCCRACGPEGSGWGVRCRPEGTSCGGPPDGSCWLVCADRTMLPSGGNHRKL